MKIFSLHIKVKEILNEEKLSHFSFFHYGYTEEGNLLFSPTYAWVALNAPR